MYIFLALFCFAFATNVLQSLQQHLRESSCTFTWQYPAGLFDETCPKKKNIKGETFTANGRFPDNPLSLNKSLSLCHHTGIPASQENQSTVFLVEQQIQWALHAHM